MLILGLVIVLFVIIPVAAIAGGVDTWQDNGWSR